MTKKEFLEHEEPLYMVCSLDPKTGKVLYDTYPAETIESWLEDFEKDFPKMLHFRIPNKAVKAWKRKKWGLPEPIK